MLRRHLIALLALSATAFGCGGNDGNPSGDAGTHDASGDDVGTDDVGTDDVGTDAGTIDAHVDPCSTDNGGCDALTSCADEEGVAVCGDCPAGYLGDGLTGCEVDACATDNGGCDALRLCTSADAVPTCGGCIAGYQEDGVGGCEVDACATDNGGCDAHRPCESAAGEVTCGACEFGYDDDGVDGCVRNACTLARQDTYEPDAWLSEVAADLTSQPTTWQRSLSGGEEDWFFLGVTAGCAMTLEWTHEGTTGGANFRIWSPQYGAGTTHASGAFSETGTTTVPGTVPAGFDIDYEVVITASDLCASYSITAWMTCP